MRTGPAARNLPARRRILDELVDRASDYVALYGKNFVGVVAEESYRQTVRGGRAGTDVRGFPIEAPSQRRDLKSDVLLVRAPAGDRWIQFRDVFEVDGKPVRDREERLTKLFLQPSADRKRQEEDIAAASARYNIGAVHRTMNVPALALDVLEPSNRVWFDLSSRQPQRRDRGARVPGRGTRPHDDLDTNDNQPMPSHGRLHGRRGNRQSCCEHARDGNRSPARADRCHLRRRPGDGPAGTREMRERYTTRDGTTVEGRAT